MGFVFLLIFALVFLFSFLFGLIRGVAKMRMRVFTILISFVLALVTTFAAKGAISGEWFITGIVVPLLDNLKIDIVGDLIGMSETLNQVLLGCIGAMLAPLMFLVYFLIWSVITWIVYAIVSLFLGGLMKAHNARLSFRPLRLLGWAVLHAVIVLAVILIPVSVYTTIAPVIVDGLVEAEVIKANDVPVEDVIDPLAESGAVKTFKKLGGEAICTSLTSFDVRGEKTTLENEAGAVTSFACNIYHLSQTELEAYGAREAAVIIAVADSFDKSELLPTIVGEVVFNAAEDWLAGREFLGVPKPDAGELFTPFLDTVLEVFMQDAQNNDALQRDIRTLAEMISTLAKHEVFAHLSDPEALIAKLDGEGAINDLVTCLGKNESMKVLIPEITNLGIRAIADTLGIPADDMALYDTFMGDVADKLNDIKSLPGETQRTEALNAELKSAFDKAGIEVEEEIISCYSTSMINDLLQSEEQELTADDVRAFFILYAMNAEQEAKESEGGSEPVSATGINKEFLAGTVYEHMDDDALAKTGAATLAKVTVKLSAVTGENAEEITTASVEIIVAAYAEMLGNDSAVIEILAGIQLTEPVKTSAVDATASLQSAEELGKVTTRVTVSDLVVVSKEVAQNITEENLEKEVEVIKSVLGAAGNVLDIGGTNAGEVDINAIASSVGQVMDALNVAGSFGEEQTSALFTAVLQSDQVRETADLDMKTATELANKATEKGNVNYTATMNSVSGSITVVTQMGKGEEIKDEDLVEIIRNITPASAAMIEVYVSADRMIGYGVPEKSAPHSASMISSVFSYLANEQIEDFDAEAAALNRILDIAMAAKENTDSKKLFGDILPSADECVNTLMKSKAIQHSLKVNMTDGEKVTVVDPYDFGNKINGDSTEKTEFLTALDVYHAEHPETDPLVLEALAATFGIVVEYK